eukprot:4870734-Prymnesium_polylepis.1
MSILRDFLFAVCVGLSDIRSRIRRMRRVRPTGPGEPHAPGPALSRLGANERGSASPTRLCR